MKRKLITQMRHMWRSNIWLVIELSVVAIVLWSFFSIFVKFMDARLQYRGYDTTDMWHAYTQTIDKESEAYKPYSDTLHSEVTDFAVIMSHLKDNPWVECVSAGTNAVPFTMNYFGELYMRREADTTYLYSGNCRMVTPEIIRMLRLEGLNGETTEQLAATIGRGEVILGDIGRVGKDWRISRPEMFNGHDIVSSSDSVTTHHVGATAHTLRRSDYEPPRGGDILMAAGPSDMQDVVIRVKEGHGNDFIESIRADDLEAGNVYLSELKSLAAMASDVNKMVNSMMRNFAIGGGFLLVIVFLGFLGTFWFRAQERTSEIAVRMVNGATRADIVRRLLGESFLLLAMGAVICAAAVVALDYFDIKILELELTETDRWLGYVLAIFSLEIMVTAGVWWPARRAMAVNMAEALKDQ